MSTRKQQVAALKEANNNLRLKNIELRKMKDICMDKKEIAEYARMLICFRNLSWGEAIKIAREVFKAEKEYIESDD